MAGKKKSRTHDQWGNKRTIRPQLMAPSPFPTVFPVTRKSALTGPTPSVDNLDNELVGVINRRLREYAMELVLQYKRPLIEVLGHMALAASLNYSGERFAQANAGPKPDHRK